MDVFFGIPCKNDEGQGDTRQAMTPWKIAAIYTRLWGYSIMLLPEG